MSRLTRTILGEDRLPAGDLMATQILSIQALSGVIDKLIAESAKTDQLISIMGMQLVSDTKENFQKERDPDGIPWKPLKRRKGKILQDTGALRTSVTNKGGKNIDRRGPTFLEWGTNLHYAKYHQDGTAMIPARPFLGIGDELSEKLEMIAGDWIEEQIKRALGE